MEDLKAQSGLSDDALKLLEKRIQSTTKAFNESDATKAAKGLKDLAANLQGAEEHGVSSAAVIAKYGSSIRDLTGDAIANGVAIPAMVQKWAEAVGKFDLSKVMDHIRQSTAQLSGELDKSFLETQGKKADEISKEVMKAFDAITKAHDDMQTSIEKRTLSATDFQITQIEKERKAQIAALDPNVLGPIYGKAVDAINARAQDLTKALIHQGELQAQANHRNLIQQVVDARNTGREMVASHLFTTKEIERQQEQSRLALKAIQEAFGKDWKKVLEKMGIDWHALEKEIGSSWTHTLHDNLLGAVKEIGQQIPNIIIQGILEGSSAEQIGEAVASQIGSALGGALGAAIGGPIGEAIGKSLGATLGPLLDKIFHNTAERLQSSVLHDFGVAIGEDLGQAIADSAIKEFHGSFQAAQIGNLDKIISAGGGITIQNLAKLEDRLHDVFALLSTGELTAAQAQDVLNKNFQTFVDFLGGDVNPALKEIIRLNKEFGTQSKAILDFVAKNADRAASGFNKIANNFLTLVTGFQSGSDDMKRLQDAINGVADSTKKVAKEAPEAHRGIEELKRAANSGFAPEFLSDVQKQLGRIGPLAQAAFGALLDGGKSVTEALAELAPGLQQIEKVLKATGQQADGFLGQIIGWEDIVSKNKELFDILSGVDDMLHGLNNAGALTQQAFASLTGTISDTFDQLIMQGVKGADAIMLMQPQLQEVWELQKDFGYSVDAATQALLDQAIAAGEVGEKHRSVQEQMLDLQKQELAVLTAIGTAFGVTIPNAIGDTGDAFDGLGQKARNALGQIPRDINIGVHYRLPELPDQFDRTNFSQGGLVPFLPNAFANGGSVPSAAMLKRMTPAYADIGAYWKWTPRGTDTIPAMVSPGEFVVSRKGVDTVGVPALKAINSGTVPSGGSFKSPVGNSPIHYNPQPSAGGSVTTINVYVNHKLDQDESKKLAAAVAPYLPGVVANGGSTHGKWARMTKGLAK
jgi:uncharacterized protein (DUF697 family)